MQFDPGSMKIPFPLLLGSTDDRNVPFREVTLPIKTTRIQMINEYRWIDLHSFKGAIPTDRAILRLKDLLTPAIEHLEFKLGYMPSTNEQDIVVPIAVRRERIWNEDIRFIADQLVNYYGNTRVLCANPIGHCHNESGGLLDHRSR